MAAAKGNAFQASSETSSWGYEPTDPSAKKRKAASISVSKGNVIRASSEASLWGYEPTIRESVHHTRHRFTICTYVNSESINVASEAPHVGILYKPKPGGDSAFQNQPAMLALMRKYNQNADLNLPETKLNSFGVAAAELARRYRCNCGCRCRRRPGRLVRCQVCWRGFGPGCCSSQIDINCCHMCIYNEPDPEPDDVKK